MWRFLCNHRINTHIMNLNRLQMKEMKTQSKAVLNDTEKFNKDSLKWQNRTANCVPGILWARQIMRSKNSQYRSHCGMQCSQTRLRIQLLNKIDYRLKWDVFSFLNHAQTTGFSQIKAEILLNVLSKQFSHIIRISRCRWNSELNVEL
jgi:hypothetical protein